MVSFSFARGNTAVRFLLIKTNHKVKYFGILERAFCMENMMGFKVVFMFPLIKFILVR